MALSQDCAEMFYSSFPSHCTVCALEILIDSAFKGNQNLNGFCVLPHSKTTMLQMMLSTQLQMTANFKALS